MRGKGKGKSIGSQIRTVCKLKGIRRNGKQELGSKKKGWTNGVRNKGEERGGVGWGYSNEMKANCKIYRAVVG